MLPEEVQHFTDTARRIAAILLLGVGAMKLLNRVGNFLSSARLPESRRFWISTSAVVLGIEFILSIALWNWLSGDDSASTGRYAISASSWLARSLCRSRYGGVWLQTNKHRQHNVRPEQRCNKLP